MTTRPGDRHVLHPGDKVRSQNVGPGEVRSRFILTDGEVRYAVEHKVDLGYKLAVICGDRDLELVERGFAGAREDSAEMEVTRLREALEGAKRDLAEIECARLGVSGMSFQTANDWFNDHACDALAKVSAALGKPSVTEPQAGPHPPTP